MDFALTDEQQQLRRTVRAFAEAEILPHVMEWDEVSKFPSELIPKLAEMGFLGVIFPEKYGGAGMGYIEYAIIIEELSRVDGSIGIIVAAHNSLCTNHIYKFGTEEQKKKYVTPLAQGKKLGCWSLTEPEAGSDAGGTRTIAVPQRRRLAHQRLEDLHDEWPLRRRLRWHGRHRRLEEEPWNFRVHRREGNSGLPPGKKENKLGLRASDTSEVVFTDCRVPAENLLGKEGEGFVNSLQILDGGRISIASLVLAWRRARTNAPSNTPSSANSSAKPIAEFQAIQFKLADMATEIEAARLPHLPGRMARRSRHRGRRLRCAHHPGIQHGKTLRRRSRPCASQTKPCKFTAATVSSRTIPRKNFIAT